MKKHLALIEIVTWYPQADLALQELAFASVYENSSWEIECRVSYRGMRAGQREDCILS